MSVSVRHSLLALAAGVLLGAAPVVAAPASAAPPPSPFRSVQLAALLSGRQEVPGPGDPRGWGAASVSVSPLTGQVCYTLTVHALFGRATEAHIHVGSVGRAGGVEAELTAPGRIGVSHSCTRISTVVARQLARWPERYYVNVHTARYPSGAIRGQLHAQR